MRDDLQGRIHMFILAAGRDDAWSQPVRLPVELASAMPHAH